MKIGLVDVDSRIPNIALMKLSAWHKTQGDQVEIASPLLGIYDRVYASKAFTFSPDDTTPWPCEVVRGGTGYDITARLPMGDLDDIMPDYELFGCDYAIGRITRGCPRRCPWCVVPKMDGNRVRQVSDLSDWWSGQEVVRLLDDNLTANADIFTATCERLAKERVKVMFEALDVRMMSAEMAQALKRVRRKGRVHFAWDAMDQETKVRAGIAALKAGGFPMSRATFYVLIGFNTTPEEDMYRVKVLDAFGFETYAMAYDKSDHYQRSFARWVNAKPVFRSCAFEDYDVNIKNGR